MINSMNGREEKGMFTNAYAYDRFMGRWSRLLAPRFLQFAGIPDCCKILDVGCGIGTLAFAITELRPNCSIVGIDTSKEYVSYAESCNNNQSDQVRFQVGDVQNIAFPDATFDISLSLLVLNFIPNPQRALSEMMRVTRPGGLVVAAVWDYGDGMEMLRLFWDSAVALDERAERLDERYMPLCRAGELAGLWRFAGLDNIHEQALEVKINFESFQDYWEPFLAGQGPAGAYVKHLGRDRLLILREEIKRRWLLLRLQQDEATPFTLRGRAWAVRGSVPRPK